MIKYVLIIIAVIGIGLFTGWLATKIYKIKRDKVKEALLSFRRSLLNKGSECNNCNTITFDYV